MLIIFPPKIKTNLKKFSVLIYIIKFFRNRLIKNKAPTVRVHPCSILCKSSAF